jgi:alpha-tubulin suppressor-like RCC1 family protein
MNRTFLSVFVILNVALLMAFARDAGANNCNPPVGGSEEIVAFAWGLNLHGQLGVPSGVNHLIPVQVQNLSGIQTIAAGDSHTLALKTDCTVWAWGLNFNGQLGDGTTIQRRTPVQVSNLSGLSGATAIAAGFNHSLALKTDATVWAWGQNSDGQLGDGTNADRPFPLQVSNLSGVTAIAAGGGHTLALKTDATVWAWGNNDNGQLGDGTNDDRSTPVQVQNLSGITAIAAGSSHGLALASDGTVWAWGANGAGQLGDGTHDDRSTPVQVQNLSRATAIAAGTGHSLALTTDGTVLAWGLNTFFQLGDGTATSRPTPAPVQNLSGATAIAAGGMHSLALKTGGTSWAWGNNDDGQLGDGTIQDRATPVQVQNLSEVTAIAAGGMHSLAQGVPLTQLTVQKILVHPDRNRLRLFNLRIDGVTVAANINAGTTDPHLVSPGNHTVGETGGTNTPIGAFHIVIGGDCADNGIVSLALGDSKTCTITNYDNFGGCRSGRICCEPGSGTEGCLVCSEVGAGCP